MCIQFCVVLSTLQYGTPSSTLYTPPTNNLTVEINPVPLSPTECDDIVPSDMNCSFITTANTIYTVEVYVANIIGRSPSIEVTFDCKLY